jgi:Protein of unknown function (DUF2924)
MSGKRGTGARGRPKSAAHDRAAIERKVEEISKLDLSSLRSRWQKTFGGDAPPGLYREFIARALAYRVQAKAYGDLDRATRQLLERVARGGESELDADRPILKPGTILVREWKGTLHRVTVLQRGFAWNGETYASLSATAGAITQSKWNGHAFFGLRQRKSPKGKPNGRG